MWKGGQKLEKDSFLVNCKNLSSYYKSGVIDNIFACPSQQGTGKVNFWLQQLIDSVSYSQEIIAVKLTSKDQLLVSLADSQEKIIHINFAKQFEYLSNLDLKDSCFINFLPEKQLVCKSKNTEIYIPMNT